MRDVARATKLAYRMLEDDRPGFLLFEVENFDELEATLDTGDDRGQAQARARFERNGGGGGSGREVRAERLLRARGRILVWEMEGSSLISTECPIPADGPHTSKPDPPMPPQRASLAACYGYACCPPPGDGFGSLHASCTRSVGHGPPFRKGRRLLGRLGVRPFYELLALLEDQYGAFRFDRSGVESHSTEVDGGLPDECAVCLDRRVTEVLPCTHAFCANCLDRWFGSQGSCPLCRATVESKGRAATHGDSWDLTAAPSLADARRTVKSGVLRILQDEHSTGLARQRRLRIC